MEWKHTKARPTASKRGGKWRLRVQYYARIKDKKAQRRKSTEDSSFRGSFGDNGWYSSEDAANSDADKFRSEVDGETKRDGRGGWRPRAAKKEAEEKAKKEEEKKADAEINREAAV